MAVKKEATISRYIGLAGDTKPTGVAPGSTFLEYDTGALYVTYDGTNWVLKPLVPGTGAGALGKSEDAAHTSGDTGVMLLAVRKDTAAALAGTDGDYIPVIVDASGRMHIAPAPANAGVNIGQTGAAGVAVAAGDANAPAANTAAVVTYNADANNKHVITGVAWSYTGGIPTGGNLLIQDGATTVFTMDIDESGPGFVVFPLPKKGVAANTAMVITLAAGGAGITGKISVLNHYVEA